MVVGPWDDEPADGQDPPAGRDRRRGAVPLLQVERDGAALALYSPGQFLADVDDLVLDGDRRAPRTSQRPVGPRFQPGLASATCCLHLGRQLAAIVWAKGTDEPSGGLLYQLIGLCQVGG
jgi:hypothetical protein